MSEPIVKMDHAEARRQGYYNLAAATRAGRRVLRWLRANDPKKRRPPHHISEKGKLVIVDRSKEKES